MRVRKQITLSKTEINHWVYLLLGGNGPPCPSSWEHLSWLGSNGLNGNGDRGSVGGLRGKGLKASTGSITIGKGRSVLRVTPHPPFIAFPRGFRVLSPW